MKNIILNCVLFFIISKVTAQDSTQKIKSPAHFQSILQVGVLTGQTESAFEVQSINGVKWKTFSACIGVGIDDYVFRTVPVFLDMRKDVLAKKNTFFVFADAGPQFSWVQDSQKTLSYYNPEYKSRFYFSAGVGYEINLLKGNALIFSAAFSLKKVNETRHTYCDFIACPETPPEVVNEYTFRRLSLKAGWTFR